MSSGQQGGKPTENDGLRKDGQPDQRVGTGEFAHGKVDPVEAGKKGGQVGGQVGGQASDGGDGDNYKPTENDGLTKSGEPDKRLKGN